jgi:hypothetical protein
LQGSEVDDSVNPMVGDHLLDRSEVGDVPGYQSRLISEIRWRYLM